MEPPKPGAQATSALTIGDLARRTGLTPAQLRTWETRHGFPSPRRLDSGHRRYAEADVGLVRRVLRRHAAGVRLDVAIADVVATGQPRRSSVFAAVRDRHRQLVPHRLRKSTMQALSRAIEDEVLAGAHEAALFGAFQREQFFRDAEARWRELARVARCVLAFADFETTTPVGEGTVGLVALPVRAALVREWAVVCDAGPLPACLMGWELPGQEGVADADRVFEAVWSLDPRVVRDAARVCTEVARAAGALPGGAGLEWVEDPPGPPADLADASALFNRAVAYGDARRQ